MADPFPGILRQQCFEFGLGPLVVEIHGGPNVPATAWGYATEVQFLASRGYATSIAGIAGRLFLSESTVRNYLSNAIGKTGTRNKTEAALLARRNGWL